MVQTKLKTIKSIIMKRRTFLFTQLFLALFIAGCVTQQFTFSPANPNPAPNATFYNLPGTKLATFKDVVGRYITDRWDMCNKYLSEERNIDRYGLKDEEREDALSVWFPLDTLEMFLSNIKYFASLLNNHSNKLGPTTLGVRMYYAVYGPGHDSYSGKHTIFMMPTFDVGSGKHVDFDPQSLVKEGLDTVKPLRDFINEITKNKVTGNNPKDIVLNLLAGLTQPPAGASARNSGQLCPPPRECKADLFDIIKNL
jgi:hypothetical protein